MALKVAIFYSSSTADKKLKENLEHHLNRLRTRGFIDVYDASHIEPGAPQEQSVATKLQMAEFLSIARVFFCQSAITGFTENK